MGYEGDLSLLAGRKRATQITSVESLIPGEESTIYSKVESRSIPASTDHTLLGHDQHEVKTTRVNVVNELLEILSK